jgi:hypothetical protein
MRSFSMGQLDAALREMTTGMRWQEEPQYCPRYRDRLLAVTRADSRIPGPRGLQVQMLLGRAQPLLYYCEHNQAMGVAIG